MTGREGGGPPKALPPPAASADHPLEDTGCVEEVVGAVANVAHDSGSVPQHCEPGRPFEFAGTSPRRAELAHEAACGVEYQDPQVLGTYQPRAIEHIQVALGVFVILDSP